MSEIDSLLDSIYVHFSKDGGSILKGKQWVPIPLVKALDLLTIEEVMKIHKEQNLSLEEIDNTVRTFLKNKSPKKHGLINEQVKAILESVDIYNDLSSDMEDQELVLIDKKTQRLSDYKWKALANRMKIVDPNRVKTIHGESPALKMIFDPDKPTGLNKVDTFLEYNSYEIPEWKKGYIKNGEPNPLVIRFYEHLIPDETQRRVLFSEIYRMITSRLQVAQLLYTKTKGVGKNVYVEHMSHMVGTHNYFPLESGFLKGNFTGEIRRRRLLFIDEARLLKESEKDKFKQLLNDEIVVAPKYLTPIKERNFASFILATNHNYTVWVEPNDRRFSIFDITENKLNKVLKRSEIKQLVERVFPDPQEQVNFFEYVKENMDPNYDRNDYFLNSKKAWEIIKQTARDPYKYVMDEIEAKKKPLSYIELKKGFQSKFQERGNRFPLIEDLDVFFKEFCPWPDYKQIIEVDINERYVCPAGVKHEKVESLLDGLK